MDSATTAKLALTKGLVVFIFGARVGQQNVVVALTFHTKILGGLMNYSHLHFFFSSFLFFCLFVGFFVFFCSGDKLTRNGKKVR